MRNLYKIVIEKKEIAEEFLNSKYSDFILEIFAPVPVFKFKANRKINFILFLLGLIVFFSAFIFQYWAFEYYKIILSGISDFQLIFAIPFAFIISILIVAIALLIIYVTKIIDSSNKTISYIKKDELSDKYVFILEIESDLIQENLVVQYQIKYLEKLQ